MPHLSGPFLFTIAAQLSSTLVFWFGLRPDPLIVARDIAGLSPNRKSGGLRDAIAVIKEFPIAGYAVLTIALSHMVMVSVMSMTPAHLSAEGHSLAEVGFTISLHIAGMYAFSPVFGWLTDRFGAVPIVVVGQLVFIVSLAVSGFWQSEFNAVLLGLFLLGLGWSSSTVAASALLSETLATGQRTKVQGFSDSLMNLSGAFGGAVAGGILTLFTFGGLNAMALIPVVFIVLATSFSRKWR
jgi:MFS family permease